MSDTWGIEFVAPPRAQFQSSVAFDPSQLFTGGALGAWYDPSDLTALFQDVAATTPVVNDGDPVGLMRDKSGNGMDLKQATAGLRPLWHTGAGLSWIAFDGVDDEMATTSNAFTTVLPQYLIVAVSKIAQDSQGFLAVTSASTSFNVLRNFSTNSRAAHHPRLSGVAPGALNSSINSMPIGVATVVDGILTPDPGGINDIGINGGAAISVAPAIPATSAASTIGIRGLFTSSFGDSFAAGGNWYGGVVYNGDITPWRAPLRTFIGAKAGLAI